MAEKDLTARVNICARDETGRFAGHLNSVSNILLETFGEVKGMFRRNQDLAATLRIRTEESVDAVSRIGQEVSDVEESFAQLDEKIRNGLTILDTVNNKLGDQDHQIERQVAVVEELTAAVEQISVTITSVTKLASDRAVAVNETHEVIGGGRSCRRGASKVG